MSFDDDALAALLWDVPALLRSKSLGARAFFRLMSLEAVDEQEYFGQGDDPMAIAARGLRRAIESEGATESLVDFRVLAEQEGLVGFLGLSLLAWWDQDFVSNADLLVSLLERYRFTVPKGKLWRLKSRAMARLAALAIDRGELERARDFVSLAVKAAPPRSHMRVALQIEAFNLFGMGLPRLAHYRNDPLVTLPWIEHATVEAARKLLADQVVELARSPWQRSIRFGKGPTDEVHAAETQAKWAGALWMLRPLRLQLASQTLLKGPENSREATFAAALWVLGRGSNVSDVVSYAERRFDSTSADILLDEFLISIGRSDPRFVDTVLAVWDLISERLADEMLTQYVPTPGDHPTLHSIRRLWAVLAVRLPELWEARYLRLDKSNREALADSITPAIAERMPIRAAEELKKDLLESLQESPTPDKYTLLAALFARLRSEEGLPSPNLPEMFKAAPPESVIEIVGRYPNWLPESLVIHAATVLRGVIESEMDDALKGTRHIGVQDPMIGLARLIASSKEIPLIAVQPITEAATREGLPGDLKFNALRALNIVIGRRKLPNEILMPAAVTPIENASRYLDPLSQISSEMLRVTQLSLRVECLEDEESVAQLVGAIRNRDARVRSLAIETIGRLLSSPPETHLPVVVLENALVAALYDPSATVVMSALAWVAYGVTPKDRSNTAMMGQRLPDLFESEGREVRQQVIRAAATLLREGVRSGEMQKLLSEGQRDRSWLVRDAASNAG